MPAKSPSGALSPYYYKGGLIYGMHYGSYFDDMEALGKMMSAEERFMMGSPTRRRILIDLYETNLTGPMVSIMAEHLLRMKSRIVKLAIACDDKNMFRAIKRLIVKANVLDCGQLYFCSDMEEGKTWLVSER
jgi:hypothetical protein